MQPGELSVRRSQCHGCRRTAACRPPEVRELVVRGGQGPPMTLSQLPADDYAETA